MASKTDLDGYLVNEENALLARLQAWVGSVQEHQLPASVTLSWRHGGGASWERFGEFPIAGLPISAAGVVDRVRELVVGHLGPQPQGGSLRVRVALAGKKAMPEIDHTRTLIAGDEDDLSQTGWLRAQLASERAHTQQLQAQLVAMSGVVVQGSAAANTLAAAQAQTIGTLGTARSAATAADEFAKITTIMGTLAMLYFLPQIKARLGVAPDAPLEDVARAATRLLGGRSQVPKPPAGAKAPAELGSKTPPQLEAADEVEDVSSPEQDVADFVSRFREDDDFRRAVGRVALRDERLREELTQAAMDAMRTA